MDAQLFQARAHHQWIRLTDEVGLLPRSQFNRCNQGPAGRDDAPVARAGHIPIGANKLSPFVDQLGCLYDHFIIIACRFADDYVFRIDIIERNTNFIQGIDQAMGPDDVSRTAWSLGFQEMSRRQGARIKMTFLDIQSHRLKLFAKFQRGPFARIGKEQKLLLFFLEPVHKILYPRNQGAALVDNTVHITDKTFFRTYNVQIPHELVPLH